MTGGPLIPTEYARLAKEFLRGELTAAQFSLAILAGYKKETLYFENDAAEAMSALFYAAESYCDDEALRDERDIDAQQLAAAATAFVSFVDRIDPDDPS